jgi:NADH dehydrogenase FAD-containing subunit
MFWNLASVRAIIPGALKDDQVFQPLSAAFSRYPQKSYELIIGTAESSDFAAKTVTVTLGDGSGNKTLSYDQLVLATGSRTASSEVPWKGVASYEETLALLHSTSDKVKAAESIVVAGAGATGVELAGELGFEFGKTKKITLLAADSEILGGDSVASRASPLLKGLNVVIKTGAKVASTRAGADGKTEVVLDNGETITTDLYLPTMGLVPNSEYVDKKFLTEKGLVVADDFLKVTNADGVWAAGDLVSKPRAGFLITQKQVSNKI